MNKQEKDQVIVDLKEKFNNSSYIYFTDASSMTVAEVNKLRRMCFSKGIQMTVVKNKLAKKAMEQLGDERNFAQVFTALQGTNGYHVD
jgi:large subunit ribosomal protein L10